MNFSEFKQNFKVTITLKEKCSPYNKDEEAKLWDLDKENNNYQVGFQDLKTPSREF